MISVLLSPGTANSELALELEKSGARVCVWPPLSIDWPDDDSSLQDAIGNIFGYDWLILKNSRAADYFLGAFLKKHGSEELDDIRIVAIGSATAEKLSQFHVHADIALDHLLEPQVYANVDSYVGDRDSLARLNILVPSANITRESFEEQFKVAGARVDSVAAYRTCAANAELFRIKALLAGGGIDCVVLTEPSAIDELAALFDTNDLARLLRGVTVACLDPITRNRAIEFGLSGTLMPPNPSVFALTELIRSFEGDGPKNL